ncbi:MAG: hypothetical protein R3E96_08035 [Planctomycetota bacterium]
MRLSGLGRAPESVTLLGHRNASAGMIAPFGTWACANSARTERTLVAKAADLAARGLDPRWHFIGPLQRNKARRVLQHASVLHSLHSLALLETLERIGDGVTAARSEDFPAGAPLHGEAAKRGFAESELPAACESLRETPAAQEGLMTMGPLDTTPMAPPPGGFARLSELAASIRLPEPRTWPRGMRAFPWA